MSTLYLLLHFTLPSKYNSSSSREKSTVLNIGSVEYWQSIRPPSTASSLHTIIMAHGIYELVHTHFSWFCGNVRMRMAIFDANADREGGGGWERVGKECGSGRGW